MKYPITRFYRSIQGEGHRVGELTIIVGFAGCSVLDCSIRTVCDEAPWKAVETLDEDEILHRCRQLSPAGNVCLTGGEPTDHDLVPVLARLNDEGYSVHLETSGVRSVRGLPFEWITVSPKTPDYKQRSGHTLKLVVHDGWTWEDIAKFDEGTTFLHRYLQPLTFPGDRTNLPHVIDLLMAWDNYKGRWALSTQAHKTWRLP